MKPAWHRSGTGVGLALLFALAGTALAAQGVTLRYKWNKGEPVRYRTIQESTVTMSGVPGIGEMTVVTNMTQVMALKAMDVAPNGNATVETTFESIKMEVSSAAFSFAYDSAAPSQAADPLTAQLSQTFGALLGQSFTMVLTPTGAVEKVEGITKLMQNLQGASPAAAGLPGLESMSDDAMKSMFGQSFAALPARAVGPGDTWQTSVTLPNPMGEMTSAVTSTMRGVESMNGRNVAKFSSAVAISPAPGGGGAGFAGLPMAVTMGAGTGESETWFDHVLGRAIRVVGTTTLPMTMSMDAPDGSSIALQASTRVKSTFELVEK